MEALPAPRLQLLWEDIVYAVLSIVNEDAITDHLQNCFKIPEEDFSDLKEIVVEAYKKPQINVRVKSLKINCNPHIEDGQGIVCVIKIGENQHQTNEGNEKMTWDVEETFDVENLWDKRLEIETWQDQEKDQKATLGRVCLRSLDQFSKKLRQNLRSQTLASFYPTLPSDKGHFLAIKMGEGNDSALPSVNRQISPLKEDPTLLEDRNDKRRETIHVSDSNWVMNAFSSLKRSSSKKRSLPNNVTELGEDNYIDIRSPIPTGQESLTEMQRNWSMKSEKSFFSKRSSKSAYKFGSPSDRKECEQGDIKIKTKPEVQVRRQLFRDFLNPPSIIPEDEVCRPLNTGKIPLHEVKSMPKLHAISDMVPIALKHESMEEANSHSLSSERKKCLMKGLSSPSLKAGSLTLAAKNDFQLWKRMTMSSFKDKRIISPASEVRPFLCEQRDDSLSPDKSVSNYRSKGLGDQEQGEFTKHKIKTGSASVDLKELFLKMSCSKWSIEEEVDFEPITYNKTINPIKSKIQIRLELQPRFTLSSMSAFSVFILCLKQILTIELQLQVKEDEGMGLYLPLRTNSKLILKCLAFSYNLSEAHLSLACWLVLIQGHGLDNVFNMESVGDAKLAVTPEGTEEKLVNAHSKDADGANDESQQKSQRKSIGFFGEIHPKYFFHWLKKTETFVSGYREEEEKMIVSSLQSFIDSFCRQLSRIHATFPISHASHLKYGLRCIHLLSTSTSLQNLATKYGMKFENSWPKSHVLKSVLKHANNWIAALTKEISIQKVDCSSEEQHASEFESEEAVKPKIVTKYAPLMQAIMNGEKAMLAVNDFIGLGEKVYESIFQNELNESYLELIWPTITSILELVLDPIQSVLHTNNLQVQIYRGIESLQDLHMYLWILLLQLSKLQRFQISMEKQSDSIRLPETFTEAFFLLSRLWIRICLLRIEEMVDLECQADSLTSPDVDEAISSSARELTDVMHVIHEKVSRFSFPAIKKFKENLVLFLEEGLIPLVETYQRRLCHKALEANSVANTLTTQMCVALNNIHKVSLEAETLISSLSTRGEDVPGYNVPLRVQTKEASFCIFSKSLPRLQTWISNALCSKEKEDFLLDWIKSILDALLVDYAPQSKLYTILLQHFWDYIFEMMKTKQEVFTQPKDFRFLGNFMEKLYYIFKVSLRVNLHSESENEFKEFMKTIQLKASFTSEVIQIYYADRLKEQMAMKPNRKPMVINAYFCKNKGLKVDIYVCPSVEITTMDKILTSSYAKEEHNSISTLSRRSALEFGLFDWRAQNFPREFRVSTHVKRKAASVLVSLTKSSATNFYVKVSPVPAEWFKKVNSKKTRNTQKNPPVFEDQLSFNIKPTDEGVIKGGFLLFRLKYSSMSSAAVDSEAILPLKDIPILSSEEKLENKHTYLTMSSPSSLQDYKTLQELQTRKQDKDATAFITQLEQSYWPTRVD